MVNNNGWLRVVEASISVLLVVGVILSIPYNYDRAQDNRLEKQIQFVVNGLAENISLRSEVLNYRVGETSESTNNGPIIQKINQSLYNLMARPGIEIYFKICLSNETCLLEIDDVRESYSIERMITTTVATDSFLPKKIKVIALES